MRPPALAIVLGVAGLVPFAVCGLLAVTSGAETATRGLLALLAYGAVILAFLGGVHWGFALPAGPDLPGPGPAGTEQSARVQRARLALGVLPSLVGWGALLLATLGWDDLGLLALIAGFIGTIVVEAQAHRSGLMPPGYIWLRWALTVGVLLCLVSVVILRVFGGRVIL